MARRISVRRSARGDRLQSLLREASADQPIDGRVGGGLVYRLKSPERALLRRDHVFGGLGCGAVRLVDGGQ